MALITLAMNLIADLLYTLIDPRIALGLSAAARDSPHHERTE